MIFSGFFLSCVLAITLLTLVLNNNNDNGKGNNFLSPFKLKFLSILLDQSSNLSDSSDSSKSTDSSDSADSADSTQGSSYPFSLYMMSSTKNSASKGSKLTKAKASKSTTKSTVKSASKSATKSTSKSATKSASKSKKIPSRVTSTIKADILDFVKIKSQVHKNTLVGTAGPSKEAKLNYRQRKTPKIAEIKQNAPSLKLSVETLLSGQYSFNPTLQDLIAKCFQEQTNQSITLAQQEYQLCQEAELVHQQRQNAEPTDYVTQQQIEREYLEKQRKQRASFLAKLNLPDNCITLDPEKVIANYQDEVYKNPKLASIAELEELLELKEFDIPDFDLQDRDIEHISKYYQGLKEALTNASYLRKNRVELTLNNLANGTLDEKFAVSSGLLAELGLFYLQYSKKARIDNYGLVGIIYSVADRRLTHYLSNLHQMRNYVYNVGFAKQLKTSSYTGSNLARQGGVYYPRPVQISHSSFGESYRVEPTNLHLLTSGLAQGFSNRIQFHEGCTIHPYTSNPLVPRLIDDKLLFIKDYLTNVGGVGQLDEVRRAGGEEAYNHVLEAFYELEISTIPLYNRFSPVAILATTKVLLNSFLIDIFAKITNKERYNQALNSFLSVDIRDHYTFREFLIEEQGENAETLIDLLDKLTEEGQAFLSAHYNKYAILCDEINKLLPSLLKEISQEIDISVARYRSNDKMENFLDSLANNTDNKLATSAYLCFQGLSPSFRELINEALATEKKLEEQQEQLKAENKTKKLSERLEAAGVVTESDDEELDSEADNEELDSETGSEELDSSKPSKSSKSSQSSKPTKPSFAQFLTKEGQDCSLQSYNKRKQEIFSSLPKLKFFNELFSIVFTHATNSVCGGVKTLNFDPCQVSLFIYADNCGHGTINKLFTPSEFLTTEEKHVIFKFFLDSMDQMELKDYTSNVHQIDLAKQQDRLTPEELKSYKNLGTCFQIASDTTFIKSESKAMSLNEMGKGKDGVFAHQCKLSLTQTKLFYTIKTTVYRGNHHDSKTIDHIKTLCKSFNQIYQDFSATQAYPLTSEQRKSTSSSQSISAPQPTSDNQSAPEFFKQPIVLFDNAYISIDNFYKLNLEEIYYVTRARSNLKEARELKDFLISHQNDTEIDPALQEQYNYYTDGRDTGVTKTISYADYYGVKRDENGLFTGSVYNSILVRLAKNAILQNKGIEGKESQEQAEQAVQAVVEDSPSSSNADFSKASASSLSVNSAVDSSEISPLDKIKLLSEGQNLRSSQLDYLDQEPSYDSTITNPVSIRINTEISHLCTEYDQAPRDQAPREKTYSPDYEPCLSDQERYLISRESKKPGFVPTSPEDLSEYIGQQLEKDYINEAELIRKCQELKPSVNEFLNTQVKVVVTRNEETRKAVQSALTNSLKLLKDTVNSLNEKNVEVLGKTRLFQKLLGSFEQMADKERLKVVFNNFFKELSYTTGNQITLVLDEVKYQKIYDRAGIYVILTSCLDLEPLEVVRAYRSRVETEASFQVLKRVELNPLHVENDESFFFKCAASRLGLMISNGVKRRLSTSPYLLPEITNPDKVKHAQTILNYYSYSAEKFFKQSCNIKSSLTHRKAVLHSTPNYIQQICLDLFEINLNDVSKFVANAPSTQAHYARQTNHSLKAFFGIKRSGYFGKRYAAYNLKEKSRRDQERFLGQQLTYNFSKFN